MSQANYPTWNCWVNFSWLEVEAKARGGRPPAAAARFPMTLASPSIEDKIAENAGT